MRLQAPMWSFFVAALLAGCDDTPVRVPPDTGEPDIADTTDGDTGDTPDDADTTTPPLHEPVAEGAVVAGVATGPGDLLAGPKAEGRIGDLVLKNARVAFVVEGARRAGGYRMWGGTVVDAAVVREGVAGEDRFGELWFAWNLLAFRPSVAEVVSDGRDGEAVVRVSGRTDSYPWPDSFIRPVLNPGPADLAVTYTYTLRPHEDYLWLAITLTNDGDAPVGVDQPFVVMNMGDGPKAFGPGVGFGGLTGFAGTWFGAVGLEASYALELDGRGMFGGLFAYANVDLLTLPQFVLAPGASTALSFRYRVSDNGSSGFGLTTAGAIRGRVEGLMNLAPARGDAERGAAWVSARAEDGRVLAVVPIAADGTFAFMAPIEPVTLQAWATGQGGSPPVVATPPVFPVTLTLPSPATLLVTIRDETGSRIPAQLTVFREADTGTPFAPDDVRLGPALSAGRSALAYIIEPATEVRLPAGRYRAVASRGYAYELAEVALTLAPGETVPLELTVARAVDTTGWLAADMHLHARWSSDSDVPYDARVRQAAANDLPLPILTEHAYVGDLMTAAEEAGVSEWVTPIPAQEVTTFEYGHFNAFPFVYDPDLPSGGAVFEHGRPGTELFAAMRAQQPEPVLIQVNHPRSSTPFFAYFDYLGLDSTTGIATRPERFTTDWDLLEVFNGRCVGSANNDRTLADWIALTNLGWKKTLSSGSDSHSEGAGIGTPRGYIALDQTALELDPQAIVAPLKARKTFVSCGPFVRFASSDGAQMGELASVDSDGEVSFAVVVEAPTWIGVTAVRLWENGVPVVTETFADAHRGPDEARPAKRFDGVLRHRPTADAWYVVEVLGEGSLAPVEMADGPYALTNPIEVDADGDGVWTPPGSRSGRTR